MNVSISSSYHENSIVNVCRALVSRNALNRYYTPLYLTRLAHAAGHIPGLGAELRKNFERRGFVGVPSGRVQCAASGSELVHLAARKLFNRRFPRLPAARMYVTKARFDAVVARHLGRNPPQAFIGMYASSRDSFHIVRRLGGLTVLNFVNSHPQEHNRYLMEMAGIEPTHHELVPAWVASRVERELAGADLILVPSRFVETQLTVHGVACEKICVIPYGVDLQTFHPATEARCVGAAVECLYVGQISHRKGIGVLLRAARKLRRLPVRFRMIGPIVSRELLANLPGNVVYSGSKYTGSVAELMRQSDIFVLPTLEDAFALVVFEAMATGLPVVTTSHAGASELIANGRDGVVIPPGDEDALVEAIRALMESPDRRCELGMAGRRKVQAAYSWNDYSGRVLQEIAVRLF